MYNFMFILHDTFLFLYEIILEIIDKLWVKKNDDFLCYYCGLLGDVYHPGTRELYTNTATGFDAVAPKSSSSNKPGVSCNNSPPNECCIYDVNGLTWSYGEGPIPADWCGITKCICDGPLSRRRLEVNSVPEPYIDTSNVCVMKPEKNVYIKNKCEALISNEYKQCCSVLKSTCNEFKYDCEMDACREVSSDSTQTQMNQMVTDIVREGLNEMCKTVEEDMNPACKVPECIYQTVFEELPSPTPVNNLQRKYLKYAGFVAKEIQKYKIEYGTNFENVIEFSDDINAEFLGDNVGMNKYNRVDILYSNDEAIMNGISSQGDAYFCKACSSKTDNTNTETCWGLTSLADVNRGNGCSTLAANKGTGLYYGGFYNGGGDMAGIKKDGESKLGVSNLKLRFSVCVGTNKKIKFQLTDDILSVNNGNGLTKLSSATFADIDVTYFIGDNSDINQNSVYTYSELGGFKVINTVGVAPPPFMSLTSNSVAIGDIVYVIGPKYLNGETNPSIFTFDIFTRQYGTSIPAMNTPVYDPCVCTDGVDKIFVINGVEYASGKYINGIQTYSLSTKQWTSEMDIQAINGNKQIPQKVGCEYVSGSVYTFGGEVKQGSNANIVNSIFEYNVNSKVLSKIGPVLSVKRIYAQTAIGLDGKIYISCGTNDMKKNLNRVDVFDVTKTKLMDASQILNLKRQFCHLKNVNQHIYAIGGININSVEYYAFNEPQNPFVRYAFVGPLIDKPKIAYLSSKATPFILDLGINTMLNNPKGLVCDKVYETVNSIDYTFSSKTFEILFQVNSPVNSKSDIFGIKNSDQLSLTDGGYFPLLEWTSIIAVFSSDNTKIYINGKLTSTLTTIAQETTTNILQFCKDTADVYIAIAAIFDYALTEEQVNDEEVWLKSDLMRKYELESPALKARKTRYANIMKNHEFNNEIDSIKYNENINYAVIYIIPLTFIFVLIIFIFAMIYQKCKWNNTTRNDYSKVDISSSDTVTSESDTEGFVFEDNPSRCCC